MGFSSGVWTLLARCSVGYGLFPIPALIVLGWFGVDLFCGGLLSMTIYFYVWFLIFFLDFLKVFILGGFFLARG